ncbi:uncharacterized protein [Patagioenas fasciata]|uniref:uncharacterized protein n=1 Tax=Patagioenas fasciata TaxID=372321 RepID=UPI003A9981FB
MQPGSPGTQATTALGTQPGAPDAQASTSGVQPGSAGTHTTTPGVQPGSSTSQATIPGDAQEPAKPWGSTSTSSYESEMREVLSQVGQLGHLCAGLKEQVEQLKSTKAEHADLENVRRLFPEGGRQSITSILADLKCQVAFLQDMAGALHGQEEKTCEKMSKLKEAHVDLAEDTHAMQEAPSSLVGNIQETQMCTPSNTLATPPNFLDAVATFSKL